MTMTLIRWTYQMAGVELRDYADDNADVIGWDVVKLFPAIKRHK